MQNFIDILKIVGIIVVLLGPAIARGYKAMQEQAAKREAELRKRKAQEDALRTGRFEAPPTLSPTPAAQPTVSVSPASAEMDAKRRLQELARQRRAELEQLAGGGTATGTGSPTAMPGGTSGTGGAGGAGGRTIAAPGPQPMYQPKPGQRMPGQGRAGQGPAGQGQAGHGRARPSKGSSKPGRAASQGSQRGSPQPAPMQRQPQAQRSPSAATQRASTEINFYDAAPGGHQHSSADEGESVVHRLVSDSAAESSTSDQGATSMATVRLAQALGAGGLRAKGAGGQTSAAAIAELRRAIVLREVFDPPVGLRNPASGEQDERRIA